MGGLKSRTDSKTGHKRRATSEGNAAGSAPVRTSKPKAVAATGGDDEAFPRGGGELLTPLERRQIEQQAAEALDAELAAGGGGSEGPAITQPKAKRAKVTTEGGDQEDAFFVKEASQGKLPKYVELLKAKNLSVGVKLWGIVLEVSSKGLTISLPHGLRGHVTPSEASDVLAMQLKALKAANSATAAAAAAAAAAAEAPASLQQLFHVGQYVRCSVLQLGEEGGAAAADGSSKGSSKKHGLLLSLRLKHINAGLLGDSLVDGLALPACVKSVEEHGFILSFGIKGVQGFLKRREHERVFGQGAVLLPGALVEVVVLSASDARNVSVTTDTTQVAGAVLKEWPGLSLSTLQPGALVNARVRKVMGDGLLVSFATYFHGTVDNFHLPPAPQLAAVASAAAAKAAATAAAVAAAADSSKKKGKGKVTPAVPATALPAIATASGGGPVGDWKRGFSETQKLKARILYVDPATKKVGLSLLPHLMSMSMPSPVPMLGEVFEAAVVRRVDPGLGILLDLPMGPVSCSAYVHISNVNDERVEKIDKVFSVGQTVAARVIGFRLIDGLATASMKKSVVSASVMAYKDIQVGMQLHGTVTGVEEFGLLLQITGSIRALVPTIHMSDLGTIASRKKFKVGQTVSGRVMEVNSDERKLVLTLKKVLISSKLPVLASPQQAVAGVKAHGVITGHADFGLFVTFFNNVRGLVHSSELGLKAGQKPGDLHPTGQVVKCQVLSVDPVTGKIRLTLGTKKAGATSEIATATAGHPVTSTAGDALAAASADPLGGLQPGDVVEGTVMEVQTSGSKVTYNLQVTAPHVSGISARLEQAHLADHPAAVAALADVVKPGCNLGPLLILERLEGQKVLRVTRKASMVAGASVLPKQLSDVKETALLPGYVASVTADAVFVRFLGQLTGRAGLAQLADMFVSEPGRLFSEGQSVRAQVVQVDLKAARFSVSLRPSLTASTDASFLHGMIRDCDFAETLRSSQEEAAEAAVPWAKSFAIGKLVKGSVQEAKEYGIVCDLAAHEDVVGHMEVSHANGSSTAPGTPISAAVLDVEKAVGIVDLSQKAPLVAAAGDKAGSKAAAKALKVGDRVDAVVELVKPSYLVLSLPGHRHHLAFAATSDFNQHRVEDVRRKFEVGQRVVAVLQVLPDESTGGRLLAHVCLTRLTDGPVSSDGAAGGKLKSTPGSIVTATVTGVHPTQMDVAMGRKVTGRVHITEVQDVTAASLATSSNPLDAFRVGQSLEAVVLGRLQGSEGRRHGALELSLKPSVLEAARSAPGSKPAAPISLAELQPGSCYYGWIQEVSEDHLWLLLGPSARGRCHLLDSSADPEVLTHYTEAFKQGQAVACRVLAVQSKKHTLDLSLIEPTSGSTHSSVTDFVVGSICMGRIVAADGNGVRVSLGHKKGGRVALTDIHDTYVPNALSGLTKGTYVRCAVVGFEDDDVTKHPVLSLRPSQGGAIAGLSAPDSAASTPTVPDSLSSSSLQPGSAVVGYVKRVDSKGLFLALDRSHDARVKLSNLSDGFIDDPKAAFPEGTKVEGWILAVEDGGRIEGSLRASNSSGLRKLEELTEGEVVKGSVRRVEKYGVFIEVAGSSAVGLAHISELTDGAVKNVGALFRPKQVVRAKVLKVDLEKGKLSLGLKPSYFEGMEEDEEVAEHARASAGRKGRNAAPAKPRDLDEEMADAMVEEEESEEDEPDAPATAAADSDDDADGEDVEEGSEGAEESDDEGAGGLDLDAAAAEADENGSGSDDSAGDDDMAEAAQPSEDEESEDEGAGTAAAHARVAAERSRPGTTSAPGLAGGWAELQLADEHDADAVMADQDNEDGAGSSKLSKGQKKRAREEKEQRIRALETARLQGGGTPDSADAYERLALASPNSSYVWIQFMAFYTSLGDITQARTTAERALATIHYREDQEKFNVWVAWLNLENIHGTPPEEAVMALFQRALPHCQPKKLYLALLGIFERTGKTALAETLLNTMVKRFAGSAKVWLRALQALLTRGEAGDAGKKMLDRAVAALPQRKHIKVISQAALLEFRLGSKERGRGIFEGVLRNYPKRLDLWSVYLDQEIKAGDAVRVRALFERGTHLSLPPKKMKFLFSRYLEYEKAHGDASTVAHVKKRAMEFVESTIKA